MHKYVCLRKFVITLGLTYMVTKKNLSMKTIHLPYRCIILVSKIYIYATLADNILALILLARVRVLHCTQRCIDVLKFG